MTWIFSGARYRICRSFLPREYEHTDAQDGAIMVFAPPPHVKYVDNLICSLEGVETARSGLKVACGFLKVAAHHSLLYKLQKDKGNLSKTLLDPTLLQQFRLIMLHNCHWYPRDLRLSMKIVASSGVFECNARSDHHISCGWLLKL